MDEPVDALEKLNAAVLKAKRKSSVPLPVEFIRRQDGQTPMLSQLMRGGRGGEVRLKLFLTLRMQATRHPFKVPGKTSQSLARMLNLSPDTGPRQVTSALNWLEKKKLVAKNPERGRPSGLTLLKPDGSGDPWAAFGSSRWVTLPIEIWTDGWLLRMNGRSLAIYLALRELTGGMERSGAVLPGVRKVQYGMSDDTWTRATDDLRDLGILTKTPEVYGDEDYDKRQRLRYRLKDLKDLGHPSW